MKQDLKEKINAWKAEHGKIFKTTIDGDEYIWRKLKRKEYVEIMATQENTDKDIDQVIYARQEKIAKMPVLYPDTIEEDLEKNAGLATTLADEVIAKSGFGNFETQEL